MTAHTPDLPSPLATVTDAAPASDAATSVEAAPATRTGTPLTTRLARARFRAWHRGTREADYMIGGFFDRHHAGWSEAELAWFEALLDEDEVDVMAWALGAAPAPAKFTGPQLKALQRLDYVTI